MRRKDREISQQEAADLLGKAEYGVLSTVDREGQPYGVPLSYVYKDNAIYFHCAVDGQKLDNIRDNAKVSFCAIGSTKILPETFGTLYESTVVRGIASEVYDAERHQALVLLLEKYCADFMEGGLQYIEQKTKITKVIKIEKFGGHNTYSITQPACNGDSGDAILTFLHSTHQHYNIVPF